MNRIQLIIDGEERKVLFLNYEYFCPSDKSEDKYLKTLYKNFPYTCNDRHDTFPYQPYQLPVLGDGLPDKILESEARLSASVPGGLISGVQHESEKDRYYQKLTRLRYNHGLDRLFIPNLENLYDMEVRPSEAPRYSYSGRMVGGLFNILLESTDDDDFFYHWLFRGEMKSGEFRVYRGDSDHAPVRIRFWDCYCVEIGEQMSALSPGPMYLYMRLSPAIVENRGVKFEKSWKKTELRSVPFKATPIAPPEQPKPLMVAAVEGTETSYPRGTLTYRVTGYSQPEVSDTDRRRVKWSVVVDGRDCPQNWQGETVQVSVKAEWIGKELTVTPYLTEKSSRVSVKTRIAQFNRNVFFARSKRLPGKNESGTVAEDMKYGDISEKQLIESDKGYEPLLKLQDSVLFGYMYSLAKAGSVQSGGVNSREIVDHFKSTTGTPFSSRYMDEQLKYHPTLKAFVYDEKGVLENLCDKVRECKGNLNKIELLIGEIWSTRVKFNTKKDWLNGMSISVDDTSAYEVYVEDYELVSSDTFNCKLRVKIYDHYGLDKADVEKNDWHIGFKAWYILQHVRGFRPFLTLMECVIEVNNQKF